jgi:hypothetical protein
VEKRVSAVMEKAFGKRTKDYPDASCKVLMGG